ncbi:N-6 DNA methylase [Chryseobacterium sp. MIQD13]|uniref:N-6 DNA methylase n=1 Tax=Chryseobacterium sp. MIQD13 TaxID=3422310 RepID=UPI003D299372
MQEIKDFFQHRGFDFKNTLESRSIYINNEDNLNEKIKDNVFFYKCPKPTRTSFYLILEPLQENEFILLRKYIWNENQADLIFLVDLKQETTLFGNPRLNLYYAKISPFEKRAEMDKFDIIQKNKGRTEDNHRIDSINKAQFDNGLIWHYYREFLDKIKKSKSIDKILVNTLYSLKKNLSQKINDEEKVQALIDRTLYIKYLEDNHIINSFFYEHYYGNECSGYKSLLEKNDYNNLNRLFEIIHEIFDNKLFDNPKIEKEYLTKDVCDLIYHSISGTTSSGQLSLFDFQFDILPVEFISYIYEVFLTDKQKANGIYYTPKKLAQLIVDDVIPNGKIGSVLDPSCGSGMFLIVAFQKLLENDILFKEAEQSNSIESIIRRRIELLSDNIFGIEKQKIAQRFTLFSLSLQVFKGLNQEDLKQYIAKELRINKKVELFKNHHSFFENIICKNTLTTDENLFEDKKFDYIVGNPPFFEISQNDKEYEFIKNDISIDNKIFSIEKIVGKHQISQCFFIKIKVWSHVNTRFGFVSNNSNFYNDNSIEFQNFFYNNYSVEKIYDLTKVKKILFENANESVNVLIFNNVKTTGNLIKYYPVKMGLFSQKPFELLIINPDSIIVLNQEDLKLKQIFLRDYLFSNDYDLELIRKLEQNNEKLINFLTILEGTKDYINNGLQIVGKEQIIEEFKLSEKDWKSLNKSQRTYYSDLFKQKYTGSTKDINFPTPLAMPSNLSNYKLNNNFKTYIGDKSNFQRIRSENIYTTDKILINRVGSSLKAYLSQEHIYYNFDIYSIFPKEKQYEYVILAILNSSLINYYIDIKFRKRNDSSYPKIGYEAIKNIPFPKYIEDELFINLSRLSKDLNDGKIEFSDFNQKKLDEIIYKIYNISYLEKQRVRDYFKPKTQISLSEIKLYEKVLNDTIEIYFNTSIKYSHFHYKDFNFMVLGIFLNNSESEKPSAQKVNQYTLIEIFKSNPNENFLAFQEKLYGDDCIYILKTDDNTNWSETKAFEDGQDILNVYING